MGISYCCCSKSGEVISVTAVGHYPGTITGLKSMQSVFLFFCSLEGDLKVRG